MTWPGDVVAGCAAYALYGAWLARRLPWTDGEYTLLPAGFRHFHAHNIGDEFGESVRGPRVGGVTRVTFRMPGSYWLYAWARWVPPRWQRPLGRLQSLAVSTAGVALALSWAGELGGPRAVWLAVALLVSTAALTGAYAAASYVSATAALWLAGLYAALHGAFGWAALAGLALLALRVLAWPQALLLWMVGDSAWGLAAAAVALVGLVLPNRRVFGAGWRALGRVAPRWDTTWRYAALTLAHRFEPWAGWGALAVAAGWPAAQPGLLVVASLLVWLSGPGVLMVVRPKWVVGYLPEVALPLVVGFAAHLASLPGGWPDVAFGLCVGWGLARPRHSALGGSPFRRGAGSAEAPGPA